LGVAARHGKPSGLSEARMSAAEASWFIRRVVGPMPASRTMAREPLCANHSRSGCRGQLTRAIGATPASRTKEPDSSAGARKVPLQRFVPNGEIIVPVEAALDLAPQARKRQRQKGPLRIPRRDI
jgi:hypothetical protein